MNLTLELHLNFPSFNSPPQLWLRPFMVSTFQGHDPVTLSSRSVHADVRLLRRWFPHRSSDHWNCTDCTLAHTDRGRAESGATLSLSGESAAHMADRPRQRQESRWLSGHVERRGRPKCDLTGPSVSGLCSDPPQCLPKSVSKLWNKVHLWLTDVVLPRHWFVPGRRLWSDDVVLQHSSV